MKTAVLGAVASALVSTVVVAGCDRASRADTTRDTTKDSELAAIAKDAYVYAYPLVTMEMTRRVSTNVASPKGTTAPMGQFAKLRTYPDPSFHTVTAPNADTLYTVIWLDVSKEPWVIGIPDLKGRYAIFPFLDGWTEVFQDPGKRTTGTGPQKYAITGPGWSGTLPAGVTEYKSPTAMVWMLGRIYCTGTPEDYKAVHTLQDQMTAVPLSSYGKPYTPPAGSVDSSIDMKTAVRDQVNAMDAPTYFKLVADLLKTNPPTAEDAPMVAKLAKLGVVPGQDFDASKLAADTLASVPKDAQSMITGWIKESVVKGDAKMENGWMFSTETGKYGTNYLQRAMVTWMGLGANVPEDAIYPTSKGPAPGEKYNGANKYVIHFDKGETPPVEGFWSLTMYDASLFFVPNALHRQTLSQRDKLKTNADGSIDMYLQADAPGKDRMANWLPAPKGDFVLMLRLYWPKPEILNGTWKLPQVKKVDETP